MLNSIIKGCLDIKELKKKSKLVLIFLVFSMLATSVYAADLMSFTANVKDGSGNNFGAGDVVVEIANLINFK